VTPMISLFGMRERSGGSARKRNLFTPTGSGPTRTESSSWSYSLLKTLVPARTALSRSTTYEVAEPT
jgi:hypothetical protein